jgi:hypothetical protein
MIIVVMLWATMARAQAIVLVTDNSAPAFRETAKGFLEIVPGAYSVDVSAADVVAHVRGKKPVVVCAIGGKATSMFKDAVADTPLVYATILRPESKGLVGGLVTGVPMEVSVASVVAKLKLISPRVARVGILFDPNVSAAAVKAAEGAARDIGLVLVAKPVADVKDVRPTFAAMLGTITYLARSGCAPWVATMKLAAILQKPCML